MPCLNIPLTKEIWGYTLQAGSYSKEFWKDKWLYEITPEGVQERMGSGPLLLAEGMTVYSRYHTASQPKKELQKKLPVGGLMRQQASMKSDSLGQGREKWICFLQSDLRAEDSGDLQERLKKEIEECVGENFLGSERNVHVMSHTNHDRLGNLFTDMFVRKIRWTSIVIFVSKEIYNVTLQQSLKP